jgi:transcriptional regulator with XRE-family HTH domain
LPRNLSAEDAALGEAIRLVRESKGLSKAIVARRGGISGPCLADVESGKSAPTWGSIRRIARGLDLSVPDLMRMVEKVESS